MHHRLILAALAATGGLFTTALLHIPVAAADTSAAADVVSATGADAFTIGGYTFDPFTSAGEGFAPVTTLSGASPLLELGGTALGRRRAGPTRVRNLQPQHRHRPRKYQQR